MCRGGKGVIGRRFTGWFLDRLLGGIVIWYSMVLRGVFFSFMEAGEWGGGEVVTCKEWMVWIRG